MDLKETILVLAAMALTVSACGGTGENMAAISGSDTTILATGNKVTKTLEVDDFKRIMSSLYVDIHYTQGAQCKVTVSGSENAMAKANISVSNGTLTIEQESNFCITGNSNGNNCLWLDITAPDLNDIDNRGRMDLQVKALNTSGLTISNNGTLDIEAESIKCKSTGDGLNIDNRGRLKLSSAAIIAANANIDNSGMLTFNGGKMDLEATQISNRGSIDISGSLKGTSANISNSGVCKSDVTFALDKKYNYDNRGRAELSGYVTAGSIKIINSGVDLQKTKLKADTLEMAVNGRSNYEMGFSGSSAQLNCSGIGTFNLDVDCKELAVAANGRIDVKLSGTADNTEFTGSGISKIDTSRLNKF